MRKEQTIIYKHDNGSFSQIAVIPGFPFGRPELHEKVHSQKYGELKCMRVDANKPGELPYEVGFVITSTGRSN